MMQFQKPSALIDIFSALLTVAASLPLAQARNRVSVEMPGIPKWILAETKERP
jgi:hypothetical protein